MLKSIPPWTGHLKGKGRGIRRWGHEDAHYRKSWRMTGRHGLRYPDSAQNRIGWREFFWWFMLHLEYRGLMMVINNLVTNFSTCCMFIVFLVVLFFFLLLINRHIPWNWECDVLFQPIFWRHWEIIVLAWDTGNEYFDLFFFISMH